jgi:hypothetical protein
MIKIGGQKVPARTLLLMASDATLILAGLFLAISFRLLDWHAILMYCRDPRTIYRIVVAVAFCELALYYRDLYNAAAVRRTVELLACLLEAFATACLGLAILYYLAPGISLGRGIMVLSAPSVLLLLLSWRVLQSRWEVLHQSPQRVLVVGTGPAGISLVREIISHPELNLKVVGFLDEKGENIGKSLVNPGIIGAAADVEDVLSLRERRGNTPVRQLLDLKFAGIGVEDAHSMWEQISGRIHLEHLSPSWLILSEGFRKPQLLLAAKSVLDFLAAVIGLILALPVMILIGSAIWVETGGPILFRQERTGSRGRPFEILKFRSMYQNAESTAIFQHPSRRDEFGWSAARAPSLLPDAGEGNSTIPATPFRASRDHWMGPD